MNSKLTIIQVKPNTLILKGEWLKNNNKSDGECFSMSQLKEVILNVVSGERFSTELT